MENKKTETEKVKEKAVKPKKKKEDNNDIFSPENMAKMFAMFKQFEKMQENEKKENNSKNIEKEVLNFKKDVKFTKVMLSKIGDELITVKSAIDNVHFLSPKTQINYTWLHKGDVDELSVSEILAMENVSTRFLHTPWLVVEDERVVEALNLKNTYDLIKKVEDVNELVKLSKEEIRHIFDNLPYEYKNSFRDEIYTKIKNRKLNNLNTIDDLVDILNIDLDLLRD